MKIEIKKRKKTMTERDKRKMIVYEKELFSFVVCLKYKKTFKILSNLVKS